MEFIMDIIKMLALLVWIGVGVTIIGSTIYYVRIMNPMIKVYNNMFIKDVVEKEEEA